MELQFKKSTIPCLDAALREVQNSEQTLEIKLSDAMPDIGHIVSAWGQVILRSKEWRSDSVLFSGGTMVWVLYAPEDGSGERIIDGWMPFQMKWDLPEETREGDIRIKTLLRGVDARSVSARKIMVRAGVAAMAEAFCPKSAEAFTPDGTDGDIQLLRTVYPMRLPKEAGEKTFLLDEEVNLPESAPKLDKLVYFRMDPKITDKKVLANKAVFRGNANLHILYKSLEGQLHSWDFDIPFSQFAELRGEYSGDAQIDLFPEVTALELEPDESGRLRLKGGLVAQFLITDKELVELIEDAYTPGREVKLGVQNLEVPTLLESRRENLYGEQSIPCDANGAADVLFLPDFPIQRRTEGGIELEFPGTFQVLYYAEDGSLRSASAHWNGQKSLSADERSILTAIPRAGEQQVMVGGGQITVKAELPVELVTTACQSIPMVTGAEVGQSIPPDPARPSLILRRAGTGRLWDIAKSNGTTMEAIRRANNLQEEPDPKQILLIPVS